MIQKSTIELPIKSQTSELKKVKNVKKMLVPYLLLFPAFSIVMLFIVYPIVTTVIRSFQDGQTKAFTLANYQYFLTDPIQQTNLMYTLKIVIITVVLSLFFGYILALYIRFSTSKISKIVSSLNLLPRFIPGLVAVYSVIMVIRDSGVVNRVSKLFGMDIKLGWMFNETGIIIMNLWFNIPFVSLLILASLSAIQRSSIEAAKDIGANPWVIFQKIIFPVTKKEILVAMTFVFMGNVGSFTTPFLMGGNHPKMLGISLYDQFNSYMDYERTAALSVIMFLICSFSAGFYIVSNMKKKY
ncbi:MAG TPA: ABC transporter permease [Candidatus Enterococcus avicola]|uniref:ABC transporter permease n=1 Tax=Candidatus Enterococcus avicola TaxID=2838561 RepID=A0A9D2F6F6_9ENTE|nr:ABC transporter permease [Candidatus Enterococcus avicola]